MRLVQQDYADLANMLRTYRTPVSLTALLENNLHIIVSALDIAAADPAPQIAEPDGDGDRTVHATLNDAPFAPNGLALLQNRVTELEKLVNEIAKLAMHEALHGRQRDDLGFALHSWLKTRGEPA